MMIRSQTEIGLDVLRDDYFYIRGPINDIEFAHIGKYCSIGRQTVIGVGDHDYNWVTTRPIIVSPEHGLIAEDHSEPQKPAPVMGNDVWIGINIVFRGVEIGHGSFVTAGSVVAKDVEPCSTVGGIPPKHLRYRFDEDIVASLLKIEWWNWNSDKIKEEARYMYEVESFVKRHS